jgi:hypothetical protein
MESNKRFYERRASEELRAAARAVTPEARERRRALADHFARKAAECGLPSLSGLELGLASAGALEAASC